MKKSLILCMIGLSFVGLSCIPAQAQSVNLQNAIRNGINSSFAGSNQSMLQPPGDTGSSDPSDHPRDKHHHHGSGNNEGCSRHQNKDDDDGDDGDDDGN